MLNLIQMTNLSDHPAAAIGFFGADTNEFDPYLIELLRSWNTADSIFEIYDIHRADFSDGDKATVVMIDCLTGKHKSTRRVGAWRPMWPSMNWSAWEDISFSLPIIGEIQRFGRGAMHQTDETGVRRLKPMHRLDSLRPPPSKSIVEPRGHYRPVKDVSKWHRVSCKHDFRKAIGAAIEFEEQGLLTGEWTFRSSADVMAKRLRWPVLYFSSETDAVAMKLRLA